MLSQRKVRILGPGAVHALLQFGQLALQRATSALEFKHTLDRGELPAAGHAAVRDHIKALKAQMGLM